MVEREARRAAAAVLPDAAAFRDLLGPEFGAVAEHLDRALVSPVRTLTARPSKGFRARLVTLGAALVPGADAATHQRALASVAVAIELLHAGSLIVDDIQDGSAVRRGGPSIHRVHGVAGALCAGNWLYFWPMRLICQLGLPPAREHRALKLYGEALERAHYGQALDLGVRVDALERCAVPAVCDAAILLKTGAITSLAMSLGALIAGASGGALATIGRFGAGFGRALQYLDDLGNVIGRREPEKRFEDLAQRKPSGVWALAAEAAADDADFAAFRAAACGAVNDAAALAAWMDRHAFVPNATATVRGWIDEELAVLAAEAAPGGAVLCEFRALGEALLHAYQ